jgi:glycosyltransferase involved in cell wall biosynthesis
VLIGDGPMKEELILKTQLLKLDNSVFFAGYKTNAIEFIKSFDVLIVPSKQESFGRTIIEGMNVSTPVIATNIGGIPEIIFHKETGLLIGYGDINAFANAIELVFQDQDLSNKIVNNALARVKDLFGIKNYINKIDSIYSKSIYECNIYNVID